MSVELLTVPTPPLGSAAPGQLPERPVPDDETPPAHVTRHLLHHIHGQSPDLTLAGITAEHLARYFAAEQRRGIAAEIRLAQHAIDAHEDSLRLSDDDHAEQTRHSLRARYEHLLAEHACALNHLETIRGGTRTLRDTAISHGWFEPADPDWLRSRDTTVAIDPKRASSIDPRADEDVNHGLNSPH